VRLGAFDFYTAEVTADYQTIAQWALADKGLQGNTLFLLVKKGRLLQQIHMPLTSVDEAVNFASVKYQMRRGLQQESSVDTQEL